MNHRPLLFALLSLAAVVLSAGSTAQAQPAPSPAPPFSLREGDILFQALPCGGLCEAIIATTPCAADRRFNHCGIVHFRDGQPTVIEAIGSQVQETALPRFLARDTSRQLAVGRVKSASEADAAAGAARAMTYLGRPYDNVFLPGDSALYCSELVWESFREAGSGRKLFPLRPMTFKPSPGSPTHPAWQRYYQGLGAAVPEGLPGINPCAIAASPLVDFRWLPKPAATD